jgi:hypothetical protein
MLDEKCLMNFRVGFVAFVVAYALFSGVANVSAPRWSDWRRLEIEGVWSTARIQGVTLEHHNMCTFSYSVDGKEYTSRASGCGRREVGSTMDIIYLPSNPEFHATQSPRSFWLGPMLGFVLVSLFLAIGVAYNYSGSAPLIQWIKALGARRRQG